MTFEADYRNYLSPDVHHEAVPTTSSVPWDLRTFDLWEYLTCGFTLQIHIEQILPRGLNLTIWPEDLTWVFVIVLLTEQFFRHSTHTWDGTGTRIDDYVSNEVWWIELQFLEGVDVGLSHHERKDRANQKELAPVEYESTEWSKLDWLVIRMHWIILLHSTRMYESLQAMADAVWHLWNESCFHKDIQWVQIPNEIIISELYYYSGYFKRFFSLCMVCWFCGKSERYDLQCGHWLWCMLLHAEQSIHNIKGNWIPKILIC